MSYDLEIYGDRGLSVGALEQLIDLKVLRVGDASGEAWGLIHEQGMITAAGPEPVVAADLPQSVRRLGRPKIRYQVEIGLGVPAHLVDQTLQRLAGELGGGVIYEPGVGVRWPETTEELGATDPQLTRALSLQWFGRARSDPTPLAGYFAAAKAHFREAVPLRFGLQRRSVAKFGLAGMEQEWREQVSWPILAFTMRAPFDVGGLTTWHAAQANEAGLWRLELLLPADVGLEAGSRLQLREFFVGVADATGAGYGFAQVLDGAVVEGRRVGLLASTERPYPVFNDRQGLLGLTPSPAWWSWFGNPYLPLVSSWLSKHPRWELNGTMRGTWVSLSEIPKSRRQLPSTWLPGGWCARRLAFSERLRPARRRPDWTADPDAGIPPEGVPCPPT